MLELYKQEGISEKTYHLVQKAEEKVKKVFDEIDQITDYNSLKVIHAFHKHQISEVHFTSTTGYGYGDVGRDTIEKVYATLFKAEDALVRTQFISGTHALTVTLFGLLRPRDVLLSITGKPYDTLEEVIGIKKNESSLLSFGIGYEQIDLIEDDFDYKKIKETLEKRKIKVIEIQRSKGYSTRKSISIQKVEKVIKEIRKVDRDVIIMVDNCYCEFVCEKEPIEVGADIVVGSLIKNLGGGIAPNGAYVVGKRNLVHLVAERLTVPGEGKEVGPSLGLNKSLLHGLFLAPSVVGSALKTAILTSFVLQQLGYEVEPTAFEKRIDIVQNVIFGNQTDLIHFCQGIQKGSPVDAHVTPVPWDMPGYENQVIMAAGAFTSGSSIELSCDGPIRPPYIAYMQGSLTYPAGKIGLMKAIEQIHKREQDDSM